MDEEFGVSDLVEKAFKEEQKEVRDMQRFPPLSSNFILLLLFLLLLLLLLLFLLFLLLLFLLLLLLFVLLCF